MLELPNDPLQSRRIREGVIFFVGFAACVPLANWLIGNVGTACVPNGPCVIPVAPGLVAPSGVLMVGLALVLRDLVQRRLGVEWSVIGILVGAALSSTFAPASLVTASVLAFMLSEIADLCVFTPLQRKRFVLAAVASSVAGIVVDSIVFLYLAFGSLDFLIGQVIGKAWMVAAAIPVLWWLRQRDRRIGMNPA